MAVSKMWTDYSVKIGSGTYIDGVTSASTGTGLQTNVEGGDGEVYASFGSLAAGAPTARFTSLNLKAVLDALGATGAAIDGTNHCTLYSRRMAQGGTRDAAGAGTHVSYVYNNGIMVPRRISARSGSNASIDAEVTARSNGATAPVTYSATANLPGNTPGTSLVYTVGPVILDSTTLDGLQSVDVDFGIGLHVERGESEIYPSFVTVRSIRPKIRVKGVHIDQLAALTADGTSYAASLVRVFFRKRAPGSTFVLDGTAEHVKILCGLARVEWHSVDSDPKTVDIEITPWLDTGGPTNPLTISTLSAIA